MDIFEFLLLHEKCVTLTFFCIARLPQFYWNEKYQKLDVSLLRVYIYIYIYIYICARAHTHTHTIEMCMFCMYSTYILYMSVYDIYV